MSSAETSSERWPYPGLRPYNRDEIDVFFGRDQQVYSLVERLGESQFLAIVGVSGCGKSSLVRCGLLGGLESGLLRRAGADWRVVEMRPGNQPLQRLATALLSESALRDELPHDSETFLARELRSGPRTLLQIRERARLPEKTNILLLVDQFEEIFRFRQEGDSDDADAFVELLLETVKGAREMKLPVYVVLTMRSEYLGPCAIFSGLPEMLNDCQYLTPRLDRGEYRESIEGPAAVFGGEVESALVTRLLNDMYNSDEPLPVLQHLLMRLWITKERKTGAPPTLTVQDYEGEGGLANSLSKHADEIYDSLDAGKKRVAEVLFRSLCEKDIRRPTLVRKVAAIADVSVDTIVAVAERFRDRDCSFVMPPPGEDLSADTILDISHEALIRQWRRLRKWSEEEADAAKTYGLLVENAKQYKDERGQLYGGGGLSNAESWEKSTRPNKAWADRYGEPGDWELAQEFLEESRAGARRSKLKWRIIIAGFIALVLAFAAIQKRDREEITKAVNHLGKALLTSSELDALMHSRAAAQLGVKVVKNEVRLLAQSSIRKTLGERVGRALDGDLLTKALSSDPDGSWLATVSNDALLRLWKMDEFDPEIPPVPIELASCSLPGAAASPSDNRHKWLNLALAAPARGDGSPHVAVGFEGGCIEIWRGEEQVNTVLRLEGEDFRGADRLRTYALALSPDASLLAAVAESGFLEVWQLEASDPETEPRKVFFKPGGLSDSRPVVELTEDWLLTNWGLWRRTGTKSEPQLEEEDLGKGRDAVFSSGSIQAASFGARHLAIVDGVGKLRLWRLSALGRLEPIRLRRDESRSVFSADLDETTGHLFSGHRDGRIRVWDLFAGYESGVEELTPLMVLPPEESVQKVREKHLKVVTVTIRQNLLLALSAQGGMRVWRFEEPPNDAGRPPAPWDVQGQAETTGVELGGLGRWLVATSEAGEARVWDTGVEGACRPPRPGEHVDSIDVSTDGVWLAQASSLGSQNTVRFSYLNGLPRGESTCAAPVPLEFGQSEDSETHWLAYVDPDFCGEELLDTGSGRVRGLVCADRNQGCQTEEHGRGRLVLEGLAMRTRVENRWTWAPGSRDSASFGAPPGWGFSRVLGSSPDGGFLIFSLESGADESRLGKLDLSNLPGASFASGTELGLSTPLPDNSQIEVSGRVNEIIASSSGARWVLVGIARSYWELRDFENPGKAYAIDWREDHPSTAVISNQRLVVGTENGTVAVFDLADLEGIEEPENGEPIQIEPSSGFGFTSEAVSVHRDQISQLAFIPNRDNLLLTADAASRAYLWDLAKTDHAPSAPLLSLPPNSLDLVSFSEEGDVLVTGGSDGTVRVWKIDFTRPWWVPGGKSVAVRATLDAKMGHEDRLVTAVIGHREREFENADEDAKNPMSKYFLISASREGTVCNWDLGSKQLEEKAERVVGKERQRRFEEEND